jgi:hypothetical protein
VTVTEIPHGTITGYGHHACRCDECRGAQREAMRRQRRNNPRQRAYDAAQRKAWALAERRLRERHSEEFERLYAGAKKEMGL